MTMTGTSLVEGKGNTAYPLKYEIREVEYFTRQKREAQFCNQGRTRCRATHVRNKNLQLFEKWPFCCLQQFITQPDLMAVSLHDKICKVSEMITLLEQ
jgi:hypothetical protein